RPTAATSSRRTASTSRARKDPGPAGATAAHAGCRRADPGATRAAPMAGPGTVARRRVRTKGGGYRPQRMRFALIGLLVAVAVFALSGGHLLLLPLLFVLPLGGLFGGRRRRRYR